MLDKPPETNDVLGLVKDISVLWNELGSELHVPLDDRQTLRRDISLSNKDRLQFVLTYWIANETKEVKWKVILEALKALKRKDIINKVIDYLENQETHIFPRKTFFLANLEIHVLINVFDLIIIYISFFFSIFCFF